MPNLHGYLSARELGLHRAPRRLTRVFLQALRAERIIANGVVIDSPAPEENVGYEVVVENAEADSPMSPSESDEESPAVISTALESPASPDSPPAAEAVPAVGEEGSEAFVSFNSPPSSPTAWMQSSGYVLRDPVGPVPRVYYGPVADTSDEDGSEQ